MKKIIDSPRVGAIQENEMKNLDWWVQRPHRAKALLESYSNWLTANGYLDTDWRDEKPLAIDEFFKQYYKEPNF